MAGKGEKRRAAKAAKPKRRLSKQQLEYLYYVLAALVALTVLFKFVGLGGEDGGTTVSVAPAKSSVTPAKLEPPSLTVADDVGGYPYHARVEVILHNSGDRLVVVSEARIELRRVYQLPMCFTQGDIPVSNSYGVLLPADGEPGDVIEEPLHQQVGPDKADRFALNFNVEPPAEGSLDGVYLFEFDVGLVNDARPNPLPAGRVIVSLPEVPTRPHYVWIEGEGESLNETFNPSGHPVREFWGEQMRCWQSNTRLLRQAAESPAEHSPQLTEIAEDAVTPSFAAMDGGGG